MSKYAVIEVGSRQEKVVEGDILEVPKKLFIRINESNTAQSKKRVNSD